MSEDEKDEKKERVLHTRIPESLEEDLKAHARSLGISVSNLVRNVLGNTLEIVDEIVQDTREVADSVRSRRRRRPKTAVPVIVGWQALTLNVNALCDACNDILRKGTGAHLAMWEGDGPRTVRCSTCVSRIGETDESS